MGNRKRKRNAYRGKEFNKITFTSLSLNREVFLLYETPFRQYERKLSD